MINNQGIQHLYEMKLAYSQSLELLSLMKDQILISNTQQRTTGGVYDAIPRAIKEGIFELVFDIVKADSQIFWIRGEKPMMKNQGTFFRLQPNIVMPKSLALSMVLILKAL